MNKTTRPFILHMQNRNYVYPESRNSLIFKVVSNAEEGLFCELIYWNLFKQDVSAAASEKMTCYARDAQFSYHEISVTTDESTRYLKYFFRIVSGKSILYLNRYGLCEGGAEHGFFEYRWTNELDVFQIPKWAQNAVCYQIFPDRFFNSAAGNKDAIEEWNAEPTRENFFGGDLKGIIQKFEHILKLRVNVIYLNPIFISPSNHKYDTTDYFLIDPQFGTIEDLKELVDLCHAHDVRVILDGVFNHCGFFFHPFQDLLQKGEASDYRDWFFPHDFPVNLELMNYDCVGYYKSMPKLCYENRDVREYFLKVGEYWIDEVGIDGWRFDVADEVDYILWEELRSRLKAKNPDVFLLGETWTDGSNLLEGNQLDSVMNYQFRDAVIDFVAKESIDAEEFDNRIMRIFGTYKRMVYPSLYNLLGSHDTPRLMTECENNIQKVKLAAVLLLTFPGMPAVYYGDETGMAGENDPGCRGGMNWDNPDSDMFGHFQKLIKIRLDNECLRKGVFRTLYCVNGIYAFVREIENERVYVAVNINEQSESLNLPVLENGSCDIFSLWSGRSFKLRAKPSKCKNPDMTVSNNSIELNIGSYCFEIISIIRRVL